MQEPRKLSSILGELAASAENKTRFEEDWLQGRSAFGGLVAAFTVTAMGKVVGSDVPLRSLMVSFIAPLPHGEVNVTTRTMRQGKNVTQLFAEVLDGDTVCLQALGVYGKARQALRVEVEHDIEFLPREQGVPFSRYADRTPPFLQAFDGSWVNKGMPFSGSKEQELAMWVKHRDDLGSFPNEKLVAIADIPPPVILSYFDKPPVPASSLTWSLEFVRPPQQIKGDWFYLHFVTEAAADGYTQQSGRIFDEQGELCALSRQTMVYFG